MKKLFAMLLALAMVMSMVPPAVLPANAAEATETETKPFYALGWSDINRRKFSNLEGLVTMSVNATDGVVSLSFNGKSDLDEIAQSVKTMMDALPEGMRHMHLANPSNALDAAPENVVYLDAGVDQLKEQFSLFLEKYYALGGKLEGVVLDTEYVLLGSWYVYSREYYQNGVVTNSEIYNQIVANPKYETEIRPLLVERGFKFYENVGGVKSEIYSIWPNSYLPASERETYSDCVSIWNTVMGIRISQYLNESVYDPLMKYYPDAIVSDYQTTDSYAWLKNLSDSGAANYIGGNSMKAGNASNYNSYASRPSSSFFMSGTTALYQNPSAYNKAVYEDDPYNMFMWDINKFKNMYAATDTKKLTAWIAEYDYSSRAGSVSNTAYYTETILHLGLLNPEPFLIYIYRPEFDSDAEYNKRMQVISEILSELTRLAGTADRTPIETPAAWNDGFVLSGMYAGGRNLWRLTPDTTDSTTLADFKVKDQAPTFSINGSTIVFPQGRIIADGEVSVVGTCGYWIETPADVTPVIVREADRYSEYPSFAETFESYAAGTAFTGDTALPLQTWEVTASSDLLIQNGAMALTGTAALNNVKLPQNISAGDSYAKQQAWEISFTLSEAMNDGANVKLLTCGTDGGIKLENGALYYDNSGTYQQLGSVTLTAGQKYTVKREVNFTVADAYTSTYTVYNAAGTQLAQASGVAMSAITLPVTGIGISCESLTTTVLIDDYKLYPTGVATDLELYNADTGIMLDSTGATDVGNVAYRLSWMNATGEGKKVNVKVACYDSTDTLTSQSVLCTVEMAPGADGVVTGIVENTGDKVAVFLEDAGTYTPSDLPDYDSGNFAWTATEAAATPDTAKIRLLSWTTLTATEGGSPVYYKNQSYQGYTSAGAANGTGWKQVVGTVDDWNVKFEYPAGGVPTLTLKDAKMDHIGDDGTTLYTANGTDAATGETLYKTTGTLSAILPQSGSAYINDLKVILQGENHIECNNGIIRGSASATQMFRNITIVGENGGSITGTGKGIGITAADGYDLILRNATIDISTTSAGGTPVPIRTSNGSITISGGSITASNTKNVAIGAMNSGNITIQNAVVNANNTFTSASGSGAINAPGGTVTIDGGTVNAVSTNGAGIASGEAVTVKDGTVNISAGTYGINGSAQISGGTMEITAGTGAFSSAPDLSGYASWEAVAGADADTAAAVTEASAMTAKYVKLTPVVVDDTFVPDDGSTTTDTVYLRILSWTDMKAVKGGAPAYLKNQSYQGYTSAGVANGTGWKQVTGSADDWNIKFEWPADGVPTLTLKDAKLDHIGDNGSTLYTENGTDAETGATLYKSTGTLSAILPKSGTANITDLKVVLQGENLVECNNGIIRGTVGTTQYFKNITIEGENGGSLTGTGKAIGISVKSGYDLTLTNATLNISTTSSGGTPIPLRTENGDIIINGGSVTVSNTKNAAIAAITSGNITVNSGVVNVSNSFGSTSGAGAINAPGGTVTVNGGTVNGTSTNGTVLNGGNGVVINGGTLNLNSGYYGINAGDGAAIQINGGIVEITATSGAFLKIPKLGSGVVGLAGSCEEEADYYDETKYREAWVKLYVQAN